MDFRRIHEQKIQSLDLETPEKSPLDLARELLGEENVFTLDDAETYFKLTPTREDRKKLSTIPFSEQELKECRDTHILTAILPISILDLNTKLTTLAEEGTPSIPKDTKFLYKIDWYKDEPFTKDPGVAEWALIRKTPVPHSIDTTWADQQKLLTEYEETPSARVMIYSLFSHFLTTGERLFPNLYVRTKDLTARRNRVSVGDFDARGLDVYAWTDDDRDPDIGLSSARKSRGGKRLEVEKMPSIPPLPIVRNF